jgi:hypothetical protein
VEAYLWPEIHTWHGRIDWEKVGLPRPRVGRDLLDHKLKLRHGDAFGKATDDPALIEGAHASHMLVIIDEGKSVADGIWDAVEGFFANPGDHYAFALSTPGAASGRFHDICTQRPGFEKWLPIHVTIDEAVAAGRVDAGWVEERRRDWGEQSVLYRTHVLAEFAGDEDGVIPMGWVEDAQTRWRLEHPSHPRHIPRHLGVDVADQGEDRTVIATRDWWCIPSVEVFTDGDVLLHADRVHGRAQNGTRVVVDAVGIGAGTLAALRRLAGAAGKKYTPVGFVASEKTTRRDRTGTFGFTNKRAAAWWNLRELLDPVNGEDIALPDTPELLGDLTAPRWREAAGGKVLLESKDEIKRRLGRSTDLGDAVVMAFWEETEKKPPSLDGWTPLV